MDGWLHAELLKGNRMAISTALIFESVSSVALHAREAKDEFR
jgi:hypothetical protein